MRRRLRYIASWMRADLVGYTVCRVIGHRRPSDKLVAFQKRLADAFHNTPDSDARKICCVRCGNPIGVVA